MLNPWLLLGSIAFGASFSISLLMNQDWGGAIAAGLTGLATAWGTAATVNWYRNRSTDSRIATLKYQIRTLQHYRAAEQQALLELEAAKERGAQSLGLMQGDVRSRQPEMLPDRGVSWNLMATDMVESPIYPPSEIYPSSERIPPEARATGAAEADLRQFLADAAATKQKITASLNNLQADLSQLNAQTAENRQLRDQLVEEINHLSQQKQALVANTKRLQADVNDLEQCRNELDHYISTVEAKKQELETGANPLQKALQQLQTQVTALHMELQQLETQVSDRLRDKNALDQTIALLKQQHQPAQVAQEGLQKVKNSTPKPNSKKLISPPKPLPSGNGKGAEIPSKPAIVSHTPKSAPLQEREDTADDLSDLWKNFMVQLLNYEFQALRAIAEESNPLRTLNAIADESFTSLDELLDSINRQAQDIVGESVVNCRSGFAPPAIAREHQKTIKKMIETYEYLTE
jgi:chromosome segregation ATPase